MQLFKLCLNVYRTSFYHVSSACKGKKRYIFFIKNTFLTGRKQKNAYENVCPEDFSRGFGKWKTGK